MIITKLHCGLGNQMFQYAAGLALAERHKTTLKLDVSWFRDYEGMAEHNRYGLSCFNICEQFATEEEISSIQHKHTAPSSSYYEGFGGLADNTSVFGYFQDNRFFEAASPRLRNHFSFRFPPTEKARAIAQQIALTPSAVFIGFRQGDYQNKTQSGFGVLTDEYYESALGFLQSKMSGLHAFIFSDSEIPNGLVSKISVSHTLVRASDGLGAFEELRLMSLCDHAIIANSTFSWWGAWLIENPNKIVIAPDPWFVGKEFDQLDIVPPSWQRIPARHSAIMPSF